MLIECVLFVMLNLCWLEGVLQFQISVFLVGALPVLAY